MTDNCSALTCTSKTISLDGAVKILSFNCDELKVLWHLIKDLFVVNLYFKIRLSVNIGKVKLF